MVLIFDYRKGNLLKAMMVFNWLDKLDMPDTQNRMH